MIITVRGTPAPQGSKRHVGGGRMIESSRAVGPWREAVRAETQRMMENTGEKAIAGPVKIMVRLIIRRPKSHYRTGRSAHLLKDTSPLFPEGKPDGDKLLRAIFDGLTDGGAWHDDAQAVKFAGEKIYADSSLTPGCQIRIESIAP